MNNYRIYVTDPYGVQVADSSLDDCLLLNYSRREFTVGQLEISVPQRHSPNKFSFHNRIYVYYEGRLEGETFWLITNIIEGSDENGGKTWVVQAVDLMTLPKSRRAFDYADTPRTLKVGEAAAVLYEIVNENLGKDANAGLIALNPARNLSAYLEVRGLEATTPLIYKAFAWQEILATMIKICQDSIERGQYLSFDFTAGDQEKIVFQMYLDQRGRDLRGQVVLSPDYETLSNAEFEEDSSEVATAVVVAGQGEEVDREIVYVEDIERINLSPFGYIEKFRDARHLSDPDSLTSEAYTTLNDSRPVQLLRGDLQERPDAIFGVHYGFGDRVSAQIGDKGFDCRITAFSVSVTSNERQVKVDLEGTPRALRPLSASSLVVLGELDYLALNETP